MKGYDIFFIAALVLALGIVVTLTYAKKRVSSIAQKQGVDQITIDPAQSKSSFVPRVYSVVYVRMDPATQNTWVLSKADDKIRPFVRDVMGGRINHILVYGTFYKINNLTEEQDNVHLHLEDVCKTGASVFSLCTSRPPGLQSYQDPDGKSFTEHAVLLHVLGYNF